jgi:uncharacterized protein involved in high-affinity Fe2+ transport
MRLRARHALIAVLTAALLAGCGSSAGLGTTSAKHRSGGSAAMKMSASSGMAGMSMAGGGVAAEVPSVNGVKPVASQVLATAYWQGMEIQARTMTPTTFVVFDGTGHETTVKATKADSFHLMIMLSDEHTKVSIPYATVWATIFNGAGKQVYTQRQWPMLSAYMGPHYGNNVPHLAPGHYKLQLLVSPPVAARHLEYAHVWQTQHEVTETFAWKPAT